ncbi:MAG: FMN-binding protein, partial [Clostridiales bacterium]|nr:FMN-binding protein [Clostridiales bacterium]
RNQFVNKTADKFVTSKTGATADNEINAITGATMSTNGVVDGVNAAISFLNEYAGNIGGGANE